MPPSEATKRGSSRERFAVRAMLAARQNERRAAIEADVAIRAPGGITGQQLRKIWAHSDAVARRERAEREVALATCEALGIDPEQDADEDLVARLEASVEP